MKILIIAYFFPPINSIASLRPYGWAKYWAMEGHNVTVLTTSNITTELNDLHYDFKNIHIIRIPHNDIFTKIKYKIKKLLGNNKYPAPSITDLWWTIAYQKVRNRDWDFTISTYNPYVNHLVGYYLKKSNKTKLWVADYRDLWTQNHLLKFNWFENFFANLYEDKFNKTADFITTVSTPLAKQLQEKYPSSEIYAIENGFNPDDFHELPPVKYWKDDKIRLIYTGTIYPGKQDPSPLFCALNHLLSFQPEYRSFIEIIFVTGSNPDYIKDLVLRYRLVDIVLISTKLPRKQCLHMQRDADVLIFLEYNSINIDGILTGKIFEYLISGTQIIGIGLDNTSSAGKLIEASGTGIAFGHDINKIEDYFKILLQRREKPTICLNHKIIKKYSKQYIANKLINIVKTKCNL